MRPSASRLGPVRMPDRAFDPARFLAAQEGTYADALSELRAGEKRTHWMWWIFPQLPLGRSPTARAYALSGRDEAEAYLGHPVLGPRLVEACEAMLTNEGRRPEAVLGGIDALKLRSCATLFAQAEGAPEVFARVLDAFYDGAADPATIEMLDG